MVSCPLWTTKTVFTFGVTAMKKCASLALAVCAVFSASSAIAGEPKLNALGLGSMTTISQSQASTIRGQGAIVWGSSTATLARPGVFATSSNGYVASGNVLAGGVNVSVAGSTRGPVVFAGGLSVAGGF
jgi:hypothetical protein